MFTTEDYSALSKDVFYELLYRQVKAMLEDESDWIANMANVASLLFSALEDVNWVGFYRLVNENELVLGPFMGNPACTRIKVGQGVCGTSVAQGKSLIVPDVHQFDGHIACDSASNSEMVIPMFLGQKIIGVLDIDSPQFHRFDDFDREQMEKIVAVLMQSSQVE